MSAITIRDFFRGRRAALRPRRLTRKSWPPSLRPCLEAYLTSVSTLRMSPRMEERRLSWYRFLKRCIDIAVSAVGLVILSPLFAVIAIAINLVSPGPVFYKGRRVGLNGRVFRVVKFRSMVVDAEYRGGSATAEDDPRLTSLGVSLRRYKIDELPQLINVWLGDMSLVGPRPEVEKYVAQYTAEERHILDVRPGITDWASLWNFDEG